MASNAADEHDRATRRVNTVLGEDACAPLLASLPLGGTPLAQVDAVVNDVHALRSNARVAAQDIVTHAVRDSNDRARSLVGSLLHVGGQAVAATKLLSLPRAQWLQRMSRHDVGNIVHQGR